jgi:hypothetical protein
MRTCFRFQPADDDIEVLIEGDADWVSQWRAQLGLSDIGWLQRLGADGSEDDESEVESAGGVVASKPLPGPTPDPSKVVTVRRTIGDMDLDGELLKLGIFKAESPTVESLIEILDEYDEPPLPPSSGITTEPVLEGWLREVLRLAVRRFGVMGLPVDVIIESLEGRHDLDEDLVETWIERQYELGKLVKVYGGARLGYGPVPIWLDAA